LELAKAIFIWILLSPQKNAPISSSKSGRHCLRVYVKDMPISIEELFRLEEESNIAALRIIWHNN
jgi:hypothetical protein